MQNQKYTSELVTNVDLSYIYILVSMYVCFVILLCLPLRSAVLINIFGHDYNIQEQQENEYDFLDGEFGYYAIHEQKENNEYDLLDVDYV